jgi:hypothetical protein
MKKLIPVLFVCFIFSCELFIPIPVVKDAHFFGISPSTSHSIPDEEYLDYEFLGMKSIRLHLQYSTFGEEYDFSAYDTIINKCIENDIEVMMLVSYESYPSDGIPGGAPWDANQEILYYDDYLELLDILAIAAPHFSSLGVHNWEIWNEQNGSWHIDPDDYAQLITTVYERFKYTDQWDTEATIVFGGIDSVAWFDPAGSNGAARQYMQNVHSSQFMADFIQQYGRLPYDAVGLHPYGADTEAKFNHNLDDVVFSVIDAYGGCSTPVWITELGEASVDDSVNADRVENYIELAYQHPRVERLFWFKYTYQGTGPESFYSLVFDNGTKRESFYRINSINRDITKT